MNIWTAWGLWWRVGSWVYHVSTYIYYHLLFLSQSQHSIWLAAFTAPILMTVWQNTTTRPTRPKKQTNKLIKKYPHLYWQIVAVSECALNVPPWGVKKKGRGYKNIPWRQSSWPAVFAQKYRFPSPGTKSDKRSRAHLRSAQCVFSETFPLQPVNLKQGKQVMSI